MLLCCQPKVLTNMDEEGLSQENIRAHIPQAETVFRALEKTPEECTRADKAAVEFFYKKALVCVGANIKTKVIWVANNIYRKIVTKDWYFVFANGLTLLETYSSVDNICENMRRRNTSDSDSSKDCKRTRARMHTTAERAEVHKLYFHYCAVFKKMISKEGAEERMALWDGLYSPAAARASRKGAKDRQSIAPTEHQAKPGGGAPNDIDTFMMASGDFSFLNTAGTIWDDATNSMQMERQAAIDAQPTLGM